MRQRNPWFLLASILWAPVVAAETVSIATFNAEFLNSSKVHVKYGLPFNMSKATTAQRNEWNSPAIRTQRFGLAVDTVADAIKDVDADVLVLTEVGDDQELDMLVDALASRGAVYPHVEVCDCTDFNTGQHVAVLSKRPFVDGETRLRLDGRAAYDVEIDDPDEQLDTGISKGLRVAVEVENQDGIRETVYVFGLHLASERGGHESDEQRIAQASIVRRHAIPLLTQGAHVIVAGDLNDKRGQPTLRRIRGLDDIWPDLIQTGHYRFFERGEEASRWTYQFRGELNQIDHILLSYSLRKNQSDAIRTRVIAIPQLENPSVSDHRPIVVTFTMP